MLFQQFVYSTEYKLQPPGPLPPRHLPKPELSPWGSSPPLALAEQLFLTPPASQDEPSQALCVTPASRIPQSHLILLLNSFLALTPLWTSYLFISVFACLCFISSNCRTTYWRTRLWLLAAVSQGRGTKGFRGKCVGRTNASVVARFPPYSVLFVQKKKLLIFSLLGGHLFLLLLNKNFLKLS